MGLLEQEVSSIFFLAVHIEYVFAFPDSHLAVRRSVNPVMVDSPLVPQRNGPLAGAALALADQKASVDA